MNRLKSINSAVIGYTQNSISSTQLNLPVMVNENGTIEAVVIKKIQFFLETWIMNGNDATMLASVTVYSKNGNQLLLSDSDTIAQVGIDSKEQSGTGVPTFVSQWLLYERLFEVDLGDGILVTSNSLFFNILNSFTNTIRRSEVKIWYYNETVDVEDAMLFK